MRKLKPLTPQLLSPACNPALFNFGTTAEITEFVENFGQARALEALSFGIKMRTKLHHMYACGPAGLGKHYFIRHFLDKVSAKQEPPSDWCYVNNFKDPKKPIALEFTPGEGEKFKQDMKSFIEQLKFALPSMAQSKEYKSRIEKIENRYKSKEERIMAKIENDAALNNLAILRPAGSFEVVPLIDKEKMSKETFDKLNEREKKEVGNKINKIKNRLIKLKEEMPKSYEEMHLKIKEIKTDFCTAIVASLMSKLKAYYTDPKVLMYLRSVQDDIIDYPERFMKEISNKSENGYDKSDLSLYEVNLIISNDKEGHAPVIFERNPNYANLVGQLEAVTQEGNTVSDFRFIKPGALHKANGGYLLLEMKYLDKDTHAWDSLKRILLEQKITIDPSHHGGSSGPSQLEPEPIPLATKVIILGNKEYYESLGGDDDFIKLFHVFVDFETTIERTDEHIQLFTSYLARIIKKRKLGAFHRDAIAQIIDQCIRLTGDSRKISLQRSSIVELLEEARYWANVHKREVVSKEDVENAILAKTNRIDKIRKEYYEDIYSDFILINVEGEAVGQINGLSVIEVPNFSFGLPTKITATTRSGKESMIDIQREVHLGGANHSKGVLILTGFLKGRFAKEIPLFLSASLVLEQTYGSVDGDSASLAEICALISSISQVPIKQSIAVTGSVNQYGYVQSVWGINEKIEGFYDICVTKGLTQNQGVIIPQANVKNLMLKKEVVASCKRGHFHVYSVETVDEALWILTGVSTNEIQDRCDETLIRYAKLGKGISE